MALESFPQAEKEMRQIVNNTGKEPTREILQSRDNAAPPIDHKGLSIISGGEAGRGLIARTSIKLPREGDEPPRLLTKVVLHDYN
jgi:hypothetical protein